MAAIIDLGPAILDEPRRIADLAEQAWPGKGFPAKPVRPGDAYPTFVLGTVCYGIKICASLFRERPRLRAGCWRCTPTHSAAPEP